LPTFKFCVRLQLRTQRSRRPTNGQTDKRYKRFWKVYTFEGDLYIQGVTQCDIRLAVPPPFSQFYIKIVQKCSRFFSTNNNYYTYSSVLPSKCVHFARAGVTICQNETTNALSHDGVKHTSKDSESDDSSSMDCSPSLPEQSRSCFLVVRL
jgi:hypothetical protein